MSTSLAPFKFSRADLAAYSASSTHNDETITAPYTRVGASSGTATLTGMATPASGQFRILGWLRTGTVTLSHNATSSSNNRFLFNGNVDSTLGSGGAKGKMFVYDSVNARWRGVS